MKKTALYRALVGFRIVLGVTLLYSSASTTIAAVVGALTGSWLRLDIILLAGSQVVGAFLLLLPWSRRVGAALLVCSLGAAFIVRLVHHDFRLDLLVYMAGTVVVAVHEASLRSTDAGGQQVSTRSAAT